MKHLKKVIYKFLDGYVGDYINELLDHTGEKFNLRIEYITI